MTSREDRPTQAEILAALVVGQATIGVHTASVQRSHRFPFDIFLQIENMARIGGVPVAVIINELLETGLEAVKKELPEEVVQQLRQASPEQRQRRTVTYSVDTKKRSERATPKPKRGEKKP